MVKYKTFNLCYVGSNPIGLIILYNRSSIGLSLFKRELDLNKLIT